MKDKIKYLILLTIIVIAILIFIKSYNSVEDDIQLIMDYYLERIDLNNKQLKRLDKNNDSEVDLFDAVLILEEKRGDK